jgi:hypothetical protein
VEYPIALDKLRIHATDTDGNRSASAFSPSLEWRAAFCSRSVFEGLVFVASLARQGVGAELVENTKTTYAQSVRQLWVVFCDGPIAGMQKP